VYAKGMTTPNFSKRAPYPAAFRLFKQGFTLAVGSAVLIACALGVASGGAYILLGLLALVWAVDWLFGHPAGRRTRKQLQEWSIERYDTPLSDAEARLLMTPAKQEAGRVGDWCSEAANVLYQNEAGENSYIELRLVRHDGRWFFYSPDYGTEIPRLRDPQEEEEQDLSIALSPLMDEVLETGGMFFLNSGQEYTGKFAKVREEVTGRSILLLWTDQLRADLWHASAAEALTSGVQVMHILGEGLVQELLPRLERDDIYVGLNWGTEGATSYSAATVREYLARYF
jgi:hypothetical protein